MDIKITTFSNKTKEERDYRDSYTIFVNGEKKFHVCDDEPEDSNMSRSFSDIYRIPELLNLVHEAGKNGEPLNIINEEI